jgi:hypothetical protein
MPRTTNQQYLAAYRFLRAVWCESDGGVFAELSPQEQWYLHDYLRPSEQLSDEALLAHCKEISIQRPSLPQCAGRALKFLQAVLETFVEPAPAVRHQPGERLPTKRVTSISVGAVVRPKPDAAALARIIWQQVTGESVVMPPTPDDPSPVQCRLNR